MATQQRKSPTDHTGAKRDQLQQEHVEEISRRQNELTMQQRAAAESDEIHDVTTPQKRAEMERAPATRAAGSVKVVGAPSLPEADKEGTVVIRINSDLEEVTIGAGNVFTFHEGERYRVPLKVAQHLEEKGYVWH